MKKLHVKTFTILSLAAIGIVGCNGFSKMMKDANKVSYSVIPNPMQDNGDSVSITINAQYPAKFFAKKAVVTVTPTLKLSDGSEVALKSVTAVGEKGAGAGIKISYQTGGKLSYSDKVAYKPGMRMDELDLKAKLVNNGSEFAPVKIADGTITTALLIQNDDKLIAAKDKFVKTMPEEQTTHIFYVISQSMVRPAQMTSEEMKQFKEFVETGVKEGYTFENMAVSAYASPDGETQFNAHLADDRAKTAIAAMKEMFKKMEPKKMRRKGEEKSSMDEAYSMVSKFGTEEGSYKIGTTGMDWDGFKTLTENSNIKDKELILRVLTMYPDHDERMKNIKSMASTYPELANDVLPKLRRAIITLHAEKKSRSDDQLRVASISHPDSLSVEELLYAATLTTDLSQKLSIYKTAEKNYSSDWRCANNVGYVEMMQNMMSDAESEFNKANKLSPDNPVVQNNLGVIARWKGDRKAAMDYYKKATGAGPEVTYNMGLVDIQTGNYSNAASNTSGNNTFNAALAKLLSGDPTGAKSILDASNDNSAMSSYLRAIIAARIGDKSGVISNLKTATNKDASLKQQALTDCEFLKFRGDSEFKAAVQ